MIRRNSGYCHRTKNCENRPPSAGPNGLEAIGGDGLGAGLALKGLVAGLLGGNAGLRACICGVNLGLGRNWPKIFLLLMVT